MSKISSKLLTAIQNINPLWLVILILIGGAYYVGNLQGQINALKGNSGTSNSSDIGQTEVTGKPVLADNDHIRGSKDADVVIVEYSDLECPFCKQLHPVLKQAFQEYDGKIAWIYRHLPLEIHKNAEKEAQAAECAAEVGGEEKFWEFTDKVFERTKSDGEGFALDKLVPLGVEIGLSEEKFQACLDSDKHLDRVKADAQSALNIGVKGTPATFLLTRDGEYHFIRGAVPFNELKADIDEALKK